MTLKNFKRASARYGLFTTSWLIAKLPYGLVKVVTHGLLFIGFHLTVKLKRVARETLALAFRGEKDEQETRRIIRECFTHFGRGMIEMIYYTAHPERAAAKFRIEGKEHLDRALSEGRGAVAVTAHFGNFPLMMLALAQMGYPVNCVIRETRDPHIRDHVFKNMTKTKVKPIYTLPRKACVNNCLAALRNNEILFMLLDQNFGSAGGVFVDFFGRKAATATGPVVLAGRAQALILPMFVVRQEGDFHKIFIEPPRAIEPRGNGNDKIAAHVSELTRVIETYIRRYPQEWGWMHRRWKTRKPEGGEHVH